MLAKSRSRQDKGKIEKHKCHFIGQVVHAVHEQAETVCLKSGDRLPNENSGIEGYGGCEGLAIVRYCKLESHPFERLGRSP